jgi:WD40 repeat protein
MFFPSYPKAFFGRIRIWNVETGRLVATLRGHWIGTNTITFSPDGKLLASAGKEDNQILFWRVPPRNYIWLWLLSVGGLVALGYFIWFYLSGLANQSRSK